VDRWPCCRENLVSPKALEPIRRERGVARGVLDIAMAEAGLQQPGIVVVIRQLVAAGVPQHVGVRLDAELGHGGRALHHP
jgi:hypothetical protein